VKQIKVILSLSCGLYLAFVALNNVIAYPVNFEFVKHVLSMDSLFSGDTYQWKSIHAKWLHHAAYLLIILTEFVAAYFCINGSIGMWRNKEQGSDKYLKGKKRARAGLLLGFILWFVGFVVIGGEWFFMWQSSDWNGMDVAIKNAILFVLVLLYLEMKEA